MKRYLMIMTVLLLAACSNQNPILEKQMKCEEYGEDRYVDSYGPNILFHKFFYSPKLDICVHELSSITVIEDVEISFTLRDLIIGELLMSTYSPCEDDPEVDYVCTTLEDYLEYRGSIRGV